MCGYKVNKKYLLKKFPGKGGWTYAQIPEIPQDRQAHFGWVRVNGSIDDYPLKKYKLMPMGNGQLFLPVKAAIRKRIGKEAGDMVHIVLEIDHTPLELSEELKACFDNEPKEVLALYNTLTQDEQKAFFDWIYNVKSEEKKVNRIIEMMDKLAAKKKFYTK